MQFIWLFRFLRGERLEKATAKDYKRFSGMFVLTPVFIGVGMPVLNWTRASNMFALWLVFTGLTASLFFGALVWSKLVPVKFSYVFGTILWLAAFWIGWHSAK